MANKPRICEGISRQWGKSFKLPDLLLFCTGYFRGREDILFVDKKKVFTALEIDRKRLNNTFLVLMKEGLLSKNKEGCFCRHALTPEGRKAYGHLYDAIVRTTLIPGAHKCNGYLGDILNQLRDPVNIMRSVYYVMKGLDLDIVAIYQEDRIRRKDSGEILLIKELADSEGLLDIPFESLVGKLTYAGMRHSDLPPYMSTKSITDAIVNAELLRRRLRERDAFEMFIDIVRNSEVQPAYRIFAVVGMINCIRVLEGHDAAIRMIDDFFKVTSEPVYKSMLKKCKADILSYYSYSEALTIYSSCLKSLKHKFPLLRSATLNNKGVVYFIMSDWKQAIKCWREALHLSQDNGLVWAAALIKLNIADSLAKEGRYSRAKRMLGESRKFLISVDDLEGLSGYHFNMALVYTEEGNRDLALDHYRKSEGFPLRYVEKIKEQRGVVIARFKEKGWDPPEFLE